MFFVEVFFVQYVGEFKVVRMVRVGSVRFFEAWKEEIGKIIGQRDRKELEYEGLYIMFRNLDLILEMKRSV